MLCTTMWDRVPEDEGNDRFDELCDTGAWKEMITMGASTGMISNVNVDAKGEAEKILSELIKNAQPVEVAIQDEMVNQRKTVAETGAGMVLSKHLREMRAEAERKMNELHETLEKEKDAEAAKTQKLIRAQESEVTRLKEQVGEQVREWQTAQAEHLQQEQEHVNGPHEQLLQQLKNSECKMKELKGLLHKEEEAESTRVLKAMSTLQSEIDDMQRQVAVLAQPSRGLLWWLNPATWW